MAEQSRARDLSSLSSQFCGAMEGLTHQGGFVVVRTAYANNDEDDAQWAAALKKLHDYAAPSDSRAEMDPDTFALPVVSDSALLRGADHASVRTAFNQWIADFVSRARNENDDDEAWPSDIRRDVCIVIDEAALTSLLNAPDFIRGKVPNLELEPCVTVVDAEDPANVPYRGGAPYMGFTRAYVRVLSQLLEDLDSRSLERLSPVRVYDGQIPLFTGTSQGKLVDPPGGVDGRYKFPRGTPRGAQGAQAMLEEIERAVGRAGMGY